MAANRGLRIKFMKHDNLMVSYQIFHAENKMVRLVIDPEQNIFKIIDAATGFVYKQGGDVTNYEVLLRKAKRYLAEFLGVRLGKEARKPKSEPTV